MSEGETHDTETPNPRVEDKAPDNPQIEDDALVLSQNNSNEVLYYCKQQNCKGFWFIDKTEGNNIYRCPVCETYNCFKCQVIHSNMTCEEYNAKLKDARIEDVVEIKQPVQNESAWKCEFCNFNDNIMDTSICVACSHTNDNIHNTKKFTSTEYYRLLELEESTSLVPNYDQFKCTICIETIEPNNGVQLRGCLHNFCQACLYSYIENCDKHEIKCPCEGCTNIMQDREIKSLVSPEVYDRYLNISLRVGKTQFKNGYQCCVPNCQGWWIYTEGIYDYHCPTCQTKNCISCRASHDGVNCQTYQDNLYYSTDKNGIETRQQLEQMLNTGEAQHCPSCNIVVVKNGGCPEMHCTMCRTTFTWSDRISKKLKLK